MVHRLGEEVAVRLVSIATAVPPYALEQDDIAARIRAQFSRSEVVQRLMPVFSSAGIRRRYSCIPIEWYYDAHGWAERNAIYLDSAQTLLEEAARAALERAGIRASDVGAVAIVSTTGIATPSFDARLIDRLGLPNTVRRLPIFGLGCVGGAIGLARAAMLAQTLPASNVLLLVVELCALWFRRDDLAKSNVVATALFGDGAAAAVLRTGGRGPAIAASGEYTFPQTLDVMGWDVAEDGLRAIFSRDIPQLVRSRMREIVDAYLAESNLDRDAIDVFLSHPGGTKVLDALESAFGLAPGKLADSRATLTEYGNMSSVTLLFVLERALREGALAQPWRRALLSAMGPGFTAAFVTLEP
ncbi:MAG TPA: 3-oxoacyl-[acyl-carrier-protein] synthase III C-terminal domain-containing protein [Candidatus Acidoferrales bacterium]|nr:3-oxoacyl-[acyl-carrier-protein] synthase III C-terminal domain-containing protein [Candidatus Acidoferrales bacterium]